MRNLRQYLFLLLWLVALPATVWAADATSYDPTGVVIQAAPLQAGRVEYSVYDAAGTFTWTKPAGLVQAKVYVTGGGGSGSAGTYSLGSTGAGGGAGGTSIRLYDAADLSDTETVVVGAGAAYSAGGFTFPPPTYLSCDGGNSIFKSQVGYGGKGAPLATGFGSGGAGGSASGGDFNIPGNGGSAGIVSLPTKQDLNTVDVESVLMNGTGGAGYWGGAGAETKLPSNVGAGVAGAGAGSGGSGSYSHVNKIAAGSGHDGLVLIEERF